MAKQLQYQVGISANTQSFNAAVAKLKKDLDEVSKINFSINVPNSELKAAADAAKEIRTHLDKAMNATTGQLDLTKFNASLKSSGQSIQELSQKLLAAGQTGQQAFVSMAQSVGQAQVPIRQMSKTMSSLMTTLKNTVKWQLSSSLVHSLQSALSGAVNYAKDLNTSLNKIQIVTGQSADQMARFAESANKAAKQLSTTTKAYTDAALIYYQQGDTDEMVAKKAAITTKAANVAFSASAKEMSDMLTAVWNSYKVGENELQKYVDIMAALGATTATSTEEIATAMSKVAATANNVGVSMQQMSSIIATVSSTTRQSAESIGTSFKTLLARMADLKMGATDEDGIGLGQVSSQLKQVGVEVLDAQGNLRDMGTIIEELGEKWTKMNRAQQQAIAQAVAGKRQYTQLMALMDNMDKYYKNMGVAAKSGGTLDQQAATYAESWKAASDRVQASLESIYNKLLDSKGFVGFLGVLEKVVTCIDAMVDGFGGLTGVISAIGILAMNVFEKQIGNFITTLPQRLSNLTSIGRQANLNKAQNELMAGISNMRDSGTLTSSQGTRLDTTEQVMKMNQQLQLSANHLSDAQVAAAQRAIDAYKQEAEALAEIVEQQEKAEGNIKNLSQKISEMPTMDKIKGSENMTKAINDYQKSLEEIQVITQSKTSFSIDTMSFDQAVAKAKEFKNEAEEIRSKLDEMNDKQMKAWGEGFINVDKDNIKETLSILEQYGEIINKNDPDAQSGLKMQIQDILDQFDKLEDKSKIPDELRQKIQDLFSGLQTDGDKAATLLEANFEHIFDSLKKIDGIDVSKVEALEQEIKRLAEAGRLGGQHLNAMGDHIKTFMESMQEGKMSMNEVVVGYGRAIASVGMFASSISNLTKVWSSNASIGDKMIRTLTSLPMLITATTSLLKMETVATHANTAAKTLAAVATEKLGLAVDSLTVKLLSSPVFIVAAALMVIGGLIVGITSAINKANEAEEKRKETINDTNEKLKERLQTEKEENEKVAAAYNEWQRYEQERKNGAAVSDEYVSATEAVLDALGLEADKVLLTAGRYELLSKRIQEANEQRTNSALTTAKSEWYAAEGNAADVAAKYSPTQSAHVNYSYMYDDWGTKKKADAGYDTTMKAVGKQTYRDSYAKGDFYDIEGMRLFKYGWDQWFEDEIGMSYQDFMDAMGFNKTEYEDHGLIKADKEHLLSFAQNAREMDANYGEQLRAKFGDAWDWILGYAESTGGIILNAQENYAKLLGQDFLSDNYSQITPETLNIDQMKQSLKDQLVAQGVYAAEDPGLDKAVENMVYDFVSSLGDEFTEKIANVRSEEIIRKSLAKKDTRINKEVMEGAREAFNFIYGKDKEMDFDTALSSFDPNLVDTTSLSLENSELPIFLSKAVAGQYAAKLMSDAKTKNLTLGQDLIDAEQYAGTFQKTPANKEKVLPLFETYYGDAKIGAKKAEEFFSATTEAQIQMLEEMSANSTEKIKENYESARLVVVKALMGIEDVAKHAGEFGSKDGEDLVSSILGPMLDKAYWDEWRKGGEDALDAIIAKRDQIQAGVIEKRRTLDEYKQAYMEGTAEGANGETHTEEEAIAAAEAKYGYTYEQLDSIQADIDSATAATDQWVEASAFVASKLTDDTIPAVKKTVDHVKQLATVSNLVKKSAVDSSDEWSALAKTMGKSVKEVKELMASSTDESWANSVIAAAEAELTNMYRASDNLTDEQKKGKTLVSDAEYAEAESRLQKMREERDEIVYDAKQAEINKRLTELKGYQSTLANVDLNKLPTDQNSKAYKDLAAALKEANIEMDTFAGQSRLEQIKTLQTAQDNMYDKLIAKQQELIDAKQAQITSDTSAEQKEAIEKEIESLKKEKESLEKEKEEADAKSKQQEAAYYKSKVTSEANTAAAAVNKLNTEISQAQSLISTLTAAVSSGELDFSAFEQLADLDKAWGTSFVNTWKQASTAIDRAAVAAQVYQTAISKATQQQTDIITAKTKVTDNKDAFTNAMASDEAFYNYLGQSNIEAKYQQYMVQAWQNIQNTIGGMSNGDIYNAFVSELEKIADAAGENAEEITAQYHNTMQNMYKSMADNEKAQAQSVVDTWTKAFNTIKQAKMKIAEGGSLVELFAGDIDSIATILDTIMKFTKEDGSHYSLDEAASLFYSGGDAAQNALQYQAADKNKQLAAQGWNLIQGRVDTSGNVSYAGSYQAAKDAWVTEHTSTGEYKDAEAAGAAFEKAFKETMSGIGFTDDEILKLIGDPSTWSQVGDKLQLFAKATDVSIKSLEYMAKLQKEQANRDYKIAEAQANAEKKTQLANAAFSALHRETGTNVADIVAQSGVSRAEFARQAGMTITDTTTDEQIDAYLNKLTEAELSTIYTDASDAAASFYHDVTQAGQDFLDLFSNGKELDFEGNSSDKTKAEKTRDEGRKAEEEAADKQREAERQQAEADRQKATIQRTQALSSLYANGPQTAADYQTLIDAGVGASVTDIQAMTQPALREKILTQMQATLDNSIKESDWNKMTQTEQNAALAAGKKKVSDKEYAQMQNDKYATEAAAATQAYNTLNTEVQNTLSSYQTIGSALSSLDLASMPLKGTAAWATLDAQLQKSGTTLEKLSSLTGEDQIEALAKAQKDNLHDQMTEYDRLIAKAEEYSTSEKLTAQQQQEWEQKAIELKNQRAQLQSQYDQKDQETLSKLRAYYESEYAKIDKRQAEAQKQIDKIKTQAQTMGSAVETGELSQSQRAKMTAQQLAAWGTKTTAADRAQYTIDQYSLAAQQQLSLRDQKLSTISNAKEWAGVGISLYNQERPVSKDAFTDILKNTFHLTPEAKGYLSSVWDEVFGSMSDAEFAELDWNKVTSKLEEKLKQAGVELDEELQAALAEIQDSMAETYAGLTAHEQELAQNAVETWKNAFQKIASLRKSIISGEGIADALLGDLDTFVLAVNAMGGNVDDLVSKFKSGTLTASEFAIGTASEYAGKLRDSTGLNKLFAKDAEGKFITDEKGNLSLIDKDNIGAMFGIKRENFTGKDADAAYQQALEKRVNPFLQALLKSSGMDEVNANEVIAQYWEGSDEAVALITEAGTKMNKIADAYAELVVDEEDLAERKAAEEKKVSDKQKEVDTLSAEQSKHISMRDAAYSAAEAKTATAARSALLQSGYSTEDFLAEMNKTRGEGEQLTSITQVTDQMWRDFAMQMDQQAADEQSKIAELQSEIADIWAALREVLMKPKEEGGLGLGEDNKAIKALDEKIQSAKEASETASQQANAAAANVTENAIQSLINSSGMAEDAFYDLMQTISDESGSLKNVEDMTQAELLPLAQMAEYAARAADAWKELTESQEENIQMIKKGEKSNVNYLNGLRSVMNNVKTIFGNSKAVTEDFVESNIDLIEKMSKGVKGAAEEVEEQVLRAEAKMDGWDYDKEIKINFDVDHDGLVDQLTSIGELINNFGDEHANEPIGFVADIDNTPALAGLNTLLATGQMTASQLEAALNDVGWQPEIEYKQVSVDEAQNMGITGTVTVHLPTGETQTGDISGFENADAGAYIILPTIKSAKKTGGGGSSQTDKGKKGGGGGGGKKKHEQKDKQPERYHQVDRQLKKQNSLLTQNDKLKNRKYGSQYLEMLEKENKILEKQIELNKKKQKEAAKHLANDRAELESYGATFDAEGNVNYEKYKKKWDKWLKQQGEIEMDDEEWKKIQEKYEKAMEALEHYEDSQDKLRETEEEILELENKRSKLELEKITYKLEIRLEINENDLKTLDYWIKKYSNAYNSLAFADNSYEKMQKKMKEYQDNLYGLGEAKAELDAQFAAGKINQADYVEGLKKINEGILENLENIDDLDKQMREWYGDTLSAAETELRKLTAVLDHQNTVMSNYMEILKLTGQEQDYAKMAELYEAQISASQTKTEMLQRHLESLNEQKKELEAALELNPDDEYAKQQLEDLTAQIRTTEEEVQSSAIETLEAIQNKWLNTIDEITQENKKSVSTTGEDLDWVKQKWQWWNDEQEFYVDTVTELYEINKLNRKIEDQLAKTRDKNNQRQLKQLQDEINLKSKSGQLTQYELEMMDLQYQLLVKKQELEDAANAKNTVRLTRDESGNYIYQYTADQDEISKKEQEYDDVLYQINQKTEEEYKRLGNQLLSLEEELANALDELMRNQNISAEERQKRYEEIMNHYTPMIQATADKMGVVEQNLLTNQSVWTQKYGLDIEQNAKTTNDQTTKIMKGLTDNVDAFIGKLETNYEVKYTKALGDMQSKMAGVTTLIGADWDTIKTKVQQAGDEQTETKKKAAELDKTMKDSLKGIRDATSAWKAQYEQLKKDVEYYEKINTQINKIIAAQAKLSGSTPTSTQTNVDIPTPTTTGSPDGGGNPSGGGNNTPSGGGSGSKWKFTYHGSEKKGYASEAAAKNAIDSLAAADRKSKITNDMGRSVQDYWYTTIAGWANAAKSTVTKYLRGGRVDYTGPAWVDGSKNDPEYMLTSKQTSQLFQVLSSNTIENLMSTMHDATVAMIAGLHGNLTAYSSTSSYGSSMAQEVNIYAEFPAATDRNEIQEALNGLVARASQNAVTFIK